MADGAAGNRVRYWRDRDVPGLRLLHADFTHHDYTPHFHEAWVVAITEAGGSEFHSRGLTAEATGQAVLVFNPLEPHSGRMGRSDRWRYRSFYLRPSAISAVMSLLDVSEEPYFRNNLVTDPALAASFLRLHRAMEGADDPLLRQELLALSFGGLVGRHATDRPRRAPDRRRASIAQAIALIHDAHDQRLTLEDLGRVSGLTVFQTIRAFKQVTGLTPHAYLTQTRLLAAALRLERGEPLADTALAVGFYDQSAFTRQFKRTYGITPLCYARAMRG